ncbi:MBL fold metallo-hydrolase [Arthrobacter sp. FW306-2-2C-D06B]|uniref:MBL fold metallo-hydrolase n=1 Tax=Arthrobacter sp. FW306-2-2C-D06B TaxID=2879618 RepID=UPI001F2E2D61|nr:MBL fold metallo-hydrolase [Arthrobacter sp. FW306-2-2C-D06B]UKA60098.1 MBL fold metallo-hydrolase [Arthrobacter sp. FW306-2-2C-D06B]
MSNNWSAEDNVTEVADNVFFVQGPAVNWTILKRGKEFTLIDTGYPGNWPLLQSSMNFLGLSMENAAGVLLTHGHSDHIGNAARISATGIPVFASHAELPNIRREVLEQVTVKDLGLRILRPRVGAWAVHAIRSGGLSDVAVPGVASMTQVILDALPGSPRIVATGGHTSGHVSFFVPPAKAVVTGDALVTGHAVSPVRGPQLLPAIFHHHPSETLASVEALRQLGAETILPGHGPVVRVLDGTIELVSEGRYSPFA